MGGQTRTLFVALLCASVPLAAGLTAPLTSKASAQRQRQRPQPTPRAKPTPAPQSKPSAAPPQPAAPPGQSAQLNASAPEPPDPTDPAAELRLGKQSLRAARAAEALIHLGWALRLYEARGSRPGQAAAHDLLGELYERQGQYERALTHFNQALDLFAGRAAESQQAANTTSQVARVAPTTPVTSVAGEATKTVANADAFNRDLTLSKIGNMHLRRGRQDEARAAFARMSVTKPDTSALRKSMDAKEAGLGVLGSILNRDKPTISVPIGSVSSLLVVKNRYELYHQTVLYATKEIGLGRLDYAAGQYDSARKHFDAAIAATKGDIPFLGNLGQTRRLRSAARTALGDLALKQGRYGDAIDSYRRASKGAKDDKRPDLTWPALRGEARALWLQAGQEKNAKKASERRAQSLEAYGAAVRVIEEVRQGGVRADEARTTFLATTKEVYDEASAACAQLALMSTTPGAPLAGEALAYADEGLRFAEEGRARSLLELLNESGGQVTGGVPPDLLRQKRENVDRQNEIAAQLAGIAPDGSVPDKPVDKLEDELDDLQTKLDEIENRIREQNPRYKALTAPQPLALADVQRNVLDDSTALLEYSLGEEESYLWAVTKDAAAVFRLPPRATIDRQAGELRDLLVPASLRLSLVTSASGTDVRRAAAQANTPAALPPAEAFAAASRALYASVVAPAAQFVGKRRLLVVPEGTLAYVPFEALVTADAPAGAGYAALPFLVKENEVVYAPSASVVDALRRQTQATLVGAPGSVLIIADPVFDATDPRLRGQRVAAPARAVEASRELTLKKAMQDVAPADQQPADGASPRRLEATREEATQAAAAARAAGLKADPWLDLEASEENAASRDLTQYRVVHFATHGLLDTERPQFTGLVLTLVGNRGADGFLRTDEVFNLRLGRPLVMLSACETGLGRERRGEGVIGLTRAFMYAGAPAVGVTLWSVADRSTAELMTEFYRALLGRERMAPAAALREARLRMLADPRRAAPFYWAPFVVVGDWRWRAGAE